MHDRPPSRRRNRAAKRERRRLDRKAANTRKWRALLKAGGKVLTLRIMDKNALAEALLNSGWIVAGEDSEDWSLVTDRVAIMINEFVETHRDAPLLPIDRREPKAVPSSKA